MRIAVIGAGIFGVTVAVRLSQFYDVVLYDKSDKILSSASRANQLRLHRGYHYPRSPETVTQLSRSIPSFVEEYGSAIVDDYNHYYAIAKKESLVTPELYQQFCKHHGLNFEVVTNSPLVNHDTVSLTISAEESVINYEELLRICERRLASSDRITMITNTTFNHSDADFFDVVINCTYSDINHVLNPEYERDYQFEVCEKILVKPPSSLIGNSVVVMDGPFMCIDPYGRSKFSLLGNVVHAIHHSNVGKTPEVPEQINQFVNAGIVDASNITNFGKFISSGKKYIRGLEFCEYVGSMFTIRAVLPNLDKTDARPTVVTRNDSKFISVFSGKIDTCSLSANKVLEMVRSS